MSELKICFIHLCSEFAMFRSRFKREFSVDNIPDMRIHYKKARTLLMTGDNEDCFYRRDYGTCFPWRHRRLGGVTI